MSFDALRNYVRVELPELHDQLGPLRHDEVRQVFNAMTGLSVQPGDSKCGGSWLFLEKLKQMKGNGILYLVGLDAATKKIKQLNQGRIIREEP